MVSASRSPTSSPSASRSPSPSSGGVSRSPSPSSSGSSSSARSSSGSSSSGSSGSSASSSSASSSRSGSTSGSVTRTSTGAVNLTGSNVSAARVQGLSLPRPQEPTRPPESPKDEPTRLPFPPGCPDPNTLILLSDESQKRAGDLQVGDIVKTQHEDTLEWGEHKVTYVEIKNSDKLALTFDHVEFVCSTTHKFYVEGKGWTQVTEMEIGDFVIGIDQSHKLLKVEEASNGDVVVIQVEEAHTYISEGLLSHNKTILPPEPITPNPTPESGFFPSEGPSFTPTFGGGYFIPGTPTTTTNVFNGTALKTGTSTRINTTLNTRSLGNKLVSLDVLPFMRSRNIEFIAKKLKPNTVLYPFFDGQNVYDYIVPKILEIEMISGTFITGETVAGTLIQDEVVNINSTSTQTSIQFRLAAYNHKYGPFNNPSDVFSSSPYNIAEQLQPYSPSSRTLNVDTTSLSDLSLGTYGGNVFIGMTLVGKQSGATARVRERRLVSDNVGTVIGSFFIPNPNVAGNPRFSTGNKTFRLTDNIANSTIGGTFYTYAVANFFADGLITQGQETNLSIRTIETQIAIVNEVVPITNTTVTFSPGVPIFVPTFPTGGEIVPSGPGRGPSGPARTPTPDGPGPVEGPDPGPDPGPGPTPDPTPTPLGSLFRVTANRPFVGGQAGDGLEFAQSVIEYRDSNGDGLFDTVVRTFTSPNSGAAGSPEQVITSISPADQERITQSLREQQQSGTVPLISETDLNTIFGSSFTNEFRAQLEQSAATGQLGNFGLPGIREVGNIAEAISLSGGPNLRPEDFSRTSPQTFLPTPRPTAATPTTVSRPTLSTPTTVGRPPGSSPSGSATPPGRPSAPSAPSAPSSRSAPSSSPSPSPSPRSTPSSPASRPSSPSSSSASAARSSSASSTSSSPSTARRGYSGRDPLAQTFKIGSDEDQTGRYVTSVDLFFFSKSRELPVYVELRSVELGLPTQKIYPFSKVELLPDVVNVSSTGTVATRVYFQAPVFLEGNKEHALVLLSDSNDYSVFISRLGEVDITTAALPESQQRLVSTQPTLGSLFKSQNAATWSPSQFEDLKFNLYAAVFEPVGSVSFFNPELNRSNDQIAILRNNALDIESRRVRVGLGTTLSSSTISDLTEGSFVRQRDTNAIGDFAYVTGITTGSLSIVNSGIGYTPSLGIQTYSNVELISVGGFGRNATANITVTNGSITAAGISSGGTGYQVGEILTADAIGITSIGRNLRLSVQELSAFNELVIDNVQGEFEVGVAKSIQYFSVLPGVGYTDLNGGSVFADEIITERDGLTINVKHRNHGMHAIGNVVKISNAISDITPIKLTNDTEVDFTGNLVVSGLTTDFNNFENVGISSTNPGYIVVNSEIISYTGIDGNAFTGITRGVDSTLQIRHPANSFIYKYELAGVSLRRINTTHLLQDVTDITKENTLDSYYIKIDSSSNGVDRSTGTSFPKLYLNSTKSTGGPIIEATQNIQYEIAQPVVQTFTPPQTTIGASLRTISGSSINGLEESFLDRGTQSIKLNQDNFFENPRIIASRVNERTFLNNILPGNKSLQMNLTLSTTNQYLSPVIDLDRVGMILVSNRVNEPVVDYVGDERVSLIETDPNAFVYVSKPIELEVPASSIKVIVSAHLNIFNDLRAMFAIMKDKNETPIYYPFPGNGNISGDGRTLNISNNNGRPDLPLVLNSQLGFLSEELTFIDYEFTVNNLESFKYFSIKLTGSSTSQTYPPRLRDLRVIALA